MAQVFVVIINHHQTYPPLMHDNRKRGRSRAPKAGRGNLVFDELTLLHAFEHLWDEVKREESALLRLAVVGPEQRLDLRAQ